MASLARFLIAKAIEEAERQRNEIEAVVELLQWAEIMLAVERNDVLETAISSAKRKLARIEALLQKLRQGHESAER